MINFLEISKSRLRNKILLHFFTNPDDEKYLREIAIILGEDPGNLSKEMSKLEKEGIFLSADRGKQKYFSLNKKYPLFEELKSIIFKTIGIQGSLYKIVNEVVGIIFAFIYGSFAKSEESALSDIDLCLIIDIGYFNENIFLEKINDLENRISREINYIYYSEKEWYRMVKEKDSFILSILDNQKIMLKGEESEL
ncbi:MAG: nucleotidyltransferase domain-containing protein [Actinobacteria bacterium]|nr:nucleotidyltransferase domain-containing protein [Actinomycetota bacterium]